MDGFGVGFREEMRTRAGWVENGELGGGDVFDGFFELEGRGRSDYSYLPSAVGIGIESRRLLFRWFL